MSLVALTAVKGHAVSNDGGQVAVAFATKDGDELSVMIPGQICGEKQTGQRF